MKILKCQVKLVAGQLEGRLDETAEFKPLLCDPNVNPLLLAYFHDHHVNTAWLSIDVDNVTAGYTIEAVV